MILTSGAPGVRLDARDSPRTATWKRSSFEKERTARYPSFEIVLSPPPPQARARKRAIPSSAAAAAHAPGAGLLTARPGWGSG